MLACWDIPWCPGGLLGYPCMAASEAVLLKFEPEALAAVDRVCAAEGGVPRAVWIKRLCAAAVLAHDSLVAPTADLRVELAALDPVSLEGAVLAARWRSPEEVAAATGHFVGCKCLKCDEATGR